MISHLTKSLSYAVVASITTVCLLLMAFFVAEPSITRGQVDSNDFTIRQEITDENSFKVIANVTMDGTINGVTGGQATGTTEFVVLSNNAAGYTVDIEFDYDAGNDEAMVGDESGSEAIRDYDGDVGGEPSFLYVASTSAALFAYTVNSSSSDHVAQSFRSLGTDCNIAQVSSGVPVEDRCWKAPDAAGFTVVDTIEATPDGATSTLKFVVNVPNGANPTPLAETYTATATLSLFTK